jgi:hypothetical protein
MPTTSVNILIEMVEIFKTNVQEVDDANMLIQKLRKHFPNYKINFDLEDCDKILRIEGNRINAKVVLEIVWNIGYFCEAL